ncbi:MAG: MprA protease, GlyGly-CTERM protein-sorting domain-containing form [Bryobacteraceae bacterium]
MRDFEEQLKRAMARCEPPEDFGARVLGRVANESGRMQTNRGWVWFRGPWTWRLVPVTAALLLMSGGAIYQRREHAARGEAAKEKLLIAMRIAGSEMHRAQHHVFYIERAEVTQ